MILPARLHPGGFHRPAGPYSRAGRVGRRLIVYLEPSPTTPLRVALDTFRKLSAEKWTPTDAHAYHPHCSLTGFWETVPLPPAARPTQNARAVALLAHALKEVHIGKDEREEPQHSALVKDEKEEQQHLNTVNNHQLCSSHKDTATTDLSSSGATNADIRFPAPTVRPPLISPRNRTSLILPLTLSPELTRLAVRLPVLLAESGLFVNRPAPKRCDHISMAYYADEDGGTPGGPRTEERARCTEALRDMAADTLSSVFQGRESGKGLAIGEWDLCLYEQMKEARNPASGDVHTFRELGRWRVV
ncbi:hypothetical protein HDU86_000553 [Geranomyces michiganensis]|nr:hypothetical protein HDU86_000553 [Geranomyces michiganensis]